MTHPRHPTPKKTEEIAVTHIGSLRITITKTADGLREYVQVMSGDQFTVNVVLIADKIEVQDGR